MGMTAGPMHAQRPDGRRQPNRLRPRRAGRVAVNARPGIRKALSVVAILALQKTAGNRSVARLLGSPPDRMQRQPSAPSAGVGVLIVDDDVAEVAPGQLRKSQFLAALRAAVTKT